MKPGLRAALLLTVPTMVVLGAETYEKPPQAVMDILNSPTTPTLSINPTHTYAIQGSPVRYPPLAELAEPMYRLAGIRINPKINGLHNITYNTAITLVKIPEGTVTKLALPPGAKVSVPRWTADGAHFAFESVTPTAVELWVGDTSGHVHKLPNLRVNDVFGSGLVAAAGGGRGGATGGSFQWMPDGKSLLVHAVRSNRGAEPAAPKVPPAPDIQESLGGGKGAPTYEDLLTSPHDEDLFEYYGTSQLEAVDSVTGAATPIGKPALITAVHMSPDAKYFIVTSIHKPFSYSYPARQFPTEVEVWDRTGKVVKKLQSIPLGGFGRGAGAASLDDDPSGAPQNGPRNFGWRPNEPATLIWYEGAGGGRGARGGGRTDSSASENAPATPPAHDKVFAQKAPFTAAAEKIFEIDRRLNGLLWTENGHTVIVDNGGGRGGAGGGGGGARGGGRTPQPALLVDLDHPDATPKTLWSRGGGRFVNPGNPMEKSTASGERVVVLDGDNVFLTGTGPSPNGDHPFLSRYNLNTKETTALFKCDDDHYEVAEALLDAHGDKFLTRRESPEEPPNYFVRTPSGSLTAMTHYPDPQPIMRKVHKEMVNYKRPDGVDMSFTLYLPPDYKQGTRLPTVVWAYPREYEDADAAGEASSAGSQKHFTEIGGYSEIFFALDGYAVLDNASMPIVGPAKTVNDTFLDQLIMDAKAAIDKAVEMGVTDRDRVGVGGHSYGGFMTDNLLAHSRLFKAGIAESGAPNRTLTPFGFQNERRTMWEAPETYLKMSPFMYADKIKDPLLLIHGEADDNTGTFPIQSERLYEAVRGNGGTVRLVFLPFEAHGYRGRETIEHVNWEKLKWFDKYVKDPPPPGYPGTQEKQK